MMISTSIEKEMNIRIDQIYQEARGMSNASGSESQRGQWGVSVTPAIKEGED
jgi:hypothetical protein